MVSFKTRVCVTCLSFNIELLTVLLSISGTIINYTNKVCSKIKRKLTLTVENAILFLFISTCKQSSGQINELSHSENDLNFSSLHTLQQNNRFLFISSHHTHMYKKDWIKIKSLFACCNLFSRTFFLLTSLYTFRAN